MVCNCSADKTGYYLGDYDIVVVYLRIKNNVFIHKQSSGTTKTALPRWICFVSGFPLFTKIPIS